VTPPSDFSVLKNFCRKSHAKQDVKQRIGVYYQRNMTSKFIRFEIPGSLRLGKY